jgi:secondary thiamine-phosphate synthase enzyme
MEHTTIRLETSCPTEFIDLTDRLASIVAASGVRAGLLNVQSLHTTLGIMVNEHEPLLLADFAMLLDRAAPRQAVYRHDDAAVRTVNVTAEERINGHAHCQALLLAPSACLNIVDGRIRLGQWQRVFVVELDGPRRREISVAVVGERAR